MTVSITHTTPADDTFSPQGAVAWDAAHAVSGLGSLAEQNANNVSITGGSITGITDLAVADGGTGASNATDARTNLGLGTIATQAANNVSITGGSITNITDLAIADGGTGASTAQDARNNLLPAQGTNAGKYLKTDGTNASWDDLDISTADITGTLPILNGGTGATTASNARTNLGLGSIATQAANNVSITGGTIGGQDVVGFGQTVIFSKLNLMGF